MVSYCLLCLCLFPLIPPLVGGIILSIVYHSLSAGILLIDYSLSSFPLALPSSSPLSEMLFGLVLP